MRERHFRIYLKGSLSQRKKPVLQPFQKTSGNHQITLIMKRRIELTTLPINHRQIVSIDNNRLADLDKSL